MRKDHRRRFLLASGVLLATPVVSLSQPAEMLRRIGFLSLDTADSTAGHDTQQLFPASLSRLGFREGRNLVIEWRWADGKTASLQGLAEQLVRAKVDLIVARTNAPILAAKNATSVIPIVMFNGNFPVESGFVESLARPGGNVTGTSYLSSGTIFEKQIQIIKELVPRAVRVAALWNANATGRAIGKVIQTNLNRSAAALGMSLQYFEVRQPEDVPAALSAIADKRADAFWYSGDPVLRTRIVGIMSFLRERRLPSISTIPGFSEGGGLAHYAPDVSDFNDRTASYVDRILKGAQPSVLPVEEPLKYELVINQKTATALGLKIPPSVLVRADRVIE